jgi:SNF2 family DNA or RNA helicase
MENSDKIIGRQVYQLFAYTLRYTTRHTKMEQATTPTPILNPENEKKIGKSVSYFHDFLAAANLEKKEYQTEGIRFCLRNEISSSPAAPLARGGIVADEMGLGKTIMMIGLIIANFKPRTLVVLPVALVKQWEQQILKNAGHKALIYYGPDKRKITDEALAKAPVVITTYGHMVRRDISVSTATHPHHPYHLTPKNRLYGLAWDRVIFDEAHHLRSKNTQIFRSVSTLKANIRWFVTGTPIQNSIHDFYSLCALLGLEASYYTNKNNIREIVTSFVLKRTKKSVGLTLPPLTVNTITVEWESNSEMLLSRSLHSGIACLMPAPVADEGAVASTTTTTTTSTTLPALPDINRDTVPRWFPEPSEAKIGRMIQAKQSCIYPRLACRRSVPQMPPIEDANYCSKISKVIETILGRKDNGKRKIVFCHFRGEIDYIKERIIAESPELNVRFLDGRTKESERRIILAPDANVDVLILQIQTCCEGLNLQQFSEVYFVSPDWNPSVEDQAIARCHRFGQKDPVIVYRFIMEPFKLYVDADTDAMRCIDIDTIEAYTANVQNKKRIFADEELNL